MRVGDCEINFERNIRRNEAAGNGTGYQAASLVHDVFFTSSHNRNGRCHTEAELSTTYLHIYYLASIRPSEFR